MSAERTVPAAPGPGLARTRLAQVGVIAWRELAGQFLSWRKVGVYPLAFAPLLILMLHAGQDRAHRLDREITVFAGIFQLYYLRVALFFACVMVFTRSFRGEMLQRSLHYLLLAPVRRELLVVGKFLGGLAGVVIVFELGVLTCFAVMFGHFPEGLPFVQHGEGRGHLAAYAAITALACAGYGAVFLAVGLVFRNPILPALAVFALESWSGVLPPLLQRLTVTYYLKPLCHVTVPLEGIAALLTVVAEPTPAWAAVGGLLVFATAVVALCSVKVRTLQIQYTSD